ncbi:acyltransferase family protein [Caldimonas sp. KR1-144]|uniref:acyltransferase family protein n=1 Tax=Caldimonas sp. KR1-144 TaxID=3400911 RepID=UPI003C09758E
MQDSRRACAASEHYRPDIDGLRAIAVLSVLLFHLFKDLLPGGYLGVDIFFVISGYLITSILVREHQSHDFSLLRFYERRLRRLAPALMAVLAATTVAAMLVLLPLDLVGYARSLISTLAFVSNIYFWRDSNYFSRLAEEKPLLNTWSLGIEEQFYILFPLLLAACFRWKLKLFRTLLLAVAVSLAINVLAIDARKLTTAFYLLPTRAWELGLGCLLAVAPGLGLGARARAALGAVGLMLVLASLLFGDAIAPAPWPAALAACLGSALLIGSSQGGLTPVGRCLSWRPFVAVGLISYSLYLWHWPIIVLPKYYIVRELALIESLALGAISLAVATLSWRWIERPFRSGRCSLAGLAAAYAIGSLGLVAVGVAIVARDGFPARLNADAARINSVVGDTFRCPIASMRRIGQLDGCLLNSQAGQASQAQVVIFGDSHALMYAPVFERLLRAHGMSGLAMSAYGCLPSSERNLSVACLASVEQGVSTIQSMSSAKVVVIALRWSAVDEPMLRRDGTAIEQDGVQAVSEDLERLLGALRSAGKKVVIVGPLAEPGFDVASVLSRKLAFDRPLDVATGLPHDRFLQKWSSVLARFAGRQDVTFIQPHLHQCRDGHCHYIVNGQALFADANHLASAQVARFEPAFATAMGRVLSP